MALKTLRHFVGIKSSRAPLEGMTAMAHLSMTLNRCMASGVSQILHEALSPNPEDCSADRLGKVFQPETKPLHNVGPDESRK